MPRLPRILASPAPAVGEAPRLPMPSTSGLNAIAAMASTVSDAAFQFARLREAQAEEQGRDEAGRLSAGVHAQLETLSQNARMPQSDDNEFGVPAGESPSQTYLDRVRRGTGKIWKELSGAVTTPTAPRHLQAFWNRASGSALDKAAASQFQMFREEVAGEVSTVLQEQATAAIQAGDDDGRDAVLQYVGRYLQGKQGVLPADKLAEAGRAFRENVMYGRATRALDADPYQALEPLQRTMNSDAGAKLAIYQREAQERAAKELRASQAALDGQMKRYAEGVERYFVAGLDAGTTQESDFETFGSFLSSEKLDAYKKAFRARQVGGGPGDPGIIRQFKSAVYSPDLRSEGEVVRLGRQLDSAFKADLVPEAVYTPLQSHLQSLADRFNQRAERATTQATARADAAEDRRLAEVRRVREAVYGETRETIKDALRAQHSFGPEFNAQVEEVRSLALEDLARDTGRGSNRDASEWWAANKTRYTAQVTARATTRVQALKQNMSGRVPDLITADPMRPEFQQALVRLKQSRTSYPSESAWMDDVRRAEELWMLTREIKRLEVIQGLIRPAAAEEVKPK